MKKVLFLLLGLFHFYSTYAQTTFSLVIDSETTIINQDYAPALTANETGIVICTLDSGEGGSNTTFIKTDLDGTVQWIKDLEAYPELVPSLGALITTYEGNYALHGGENAHNGAITTIGVGGILTIDSMGSFVGFNQLIEEGNGAVEHGLIQLPDSTYLTMYAIPGTPPNVNNGLLKRSDSDGNILNEVEFNYNTFDAIIAFDTIADGYVTAEEIGNGADRPALIRRVNAAGDSVLWEHPSNVSSWFVSYLLLQTMHNGNVVVTWSVDSLEVEAQYYRKYVACLDGNDGHELWRVFFHEPFEKIPERLQIAANGDIIGVGATIRVSLNSVPAAWLFRISPAGELLWERVYYDVGSEVLDHPNRYSLLDVIETSDGGIAATGSVDIYRNGIGYESDTWLLKVDGNGCLNAGCDTYAIHVGAADTSTVVIEDPIEEDTTTVEEVPTEVTITPNPTNDYITVRYGLPQLDKVGVFKLYDVYGRVVLRTALADGQHEQTIPLTFLPSGVYIYQVLQNGEPIAGGKLVKH